MSSAITVEELGKCYALKHKGNQSAYSTFGELVAQQVKAPIRWARHRIGRNGTSGDQLGKVGKVKYKSRDEEFWALKDVSFEVREGEIVGIIGRNGAGKSTLLKLLSRITEPTRGRIRIRGRIASLLEVGTGFHPELTGRENIFLNGGILGMSRNETRAKFDEIVAFAEVAKFLDTPVKRYSSGMYVRLAFAVAAHLEPEILVVDEVLAVGDAEFQGKCLGKLHDVATGGRTVLFVSHNMHAVSALCNRGLLLEAGCLARSGPVKEVMDAYLSSFSKADGSNEFPDRRPGTGEYRFMSATVPQDYLGGAEEKMVDFEIKRRRNVFDRMFLAARIVDSGGTILAEFDSRLIGTWLEDVEAFGGQFRFTTPWLKPGTYRVDLFICTLMMIVDLWEGACWLTVSPILPYANSEIQRVSDNGVVFGDFVWDVGSKIPDGTGSTSEGVEKGGFLRGALRDSGVAGSPDRPEACPANSLK